MLQDGLADIPRVIQVAVAPVFLLTGVAGVLNVLTGRLARIVDRARALDVDIAATTDEARLATIHADLQVLSRRARLVNGAISLAVVCALLVCAVIALLFVDAAYRLDNSRVIAMLFIGAMVAFIGALAGFLRETSLATSSLRFGARRTP